MKQTWRRIAGLLCVLLILSLIPAVGSAEEAEPGLIDLDETELILTDEPEDEFISLLGEEDDVEDEYWEELRPFWGASYGWLRLDLDQPLLELVGHQRRGVTCACYSLAYCRTLLDGERHLFSEYNLGFGEEDAWCSWLYGDYNSFGSFSASDIYERMYLELCEGKPSVILVKGPNTRQHYIAVVGFENVTNGAPLDAYNFLILDPGAEDFEPRNMGELGYDLKRTEYGTYQVCCDRSEARVEFEAHASSYLSRCEFTYAERLLRAREDTAIQSLPCAEKLDASAAIVAGLERGDSFTVNALVKNSVGEYWYRGTDEEGTRGFVRAEYFGVGRTLCTDFAVDGIELPSLLPLGEPFALRGEIGAGHPYDWLRVAVYTGEGAKGEALIEAELAGPGRFCDLEQEIGEMLLFETLAEGDYTLVISAGYTTCCSTDGKTIQSADRTAQLYFEHFSVVPADELFTLY